MVDELNDETEARMDALEDRTRALAARVETLTAERDAAVKAKEEAERQYDRMLRQCQSVTMERDALLTAIAEAWKAADTAVYGPGGPTLAEHIRSMRAEAALARAQVEQMRGALDAYVSDDECKYGMGEECGPDDPPCRFCRGGRALSPSPASGVAEKEPHARCDECGHPREEHEYGYSVCQHGSCDHCTYFHEPPAPAPGKDEATR